MLETGIKVSERQERCCSPMFDVKILKINENIIMNNMTNLFFFSTEISL